MSLFIGNLSSTDLRLETYGYRYPFNWTTPNGAHSHLGGDGCGYTGSRGSTRLFSPEHAKLEEPCMLCMDWWRGYVVGLKTATGYNTSTVLDLMDREIVDPESRHQRLQAMRVVMCLMLDAHDYVLNQGAIK